MARLVRLFDLVVNALAVVAALLIGAVMIMVSGAVISRYFFGDPQAWVIEISEYSLLYCTLLGAAWVLRQEGHTRVDIVLNALKPRHRALLNTYTSVLGILACLILLYYSSLTLYSTYERGLVLFKIFETPKYLPLAVIPVGSFFLVLQFVRRAVGYYQEFKSITTERLESPGKPVAEQE